MGIFDLVSVLEFDENLTVKLALSQEFRWESPPKTPPPELSAKAAAGSMNIGVIRRRPSLVLTSICLSVGPVKK